MQDKDVRLMGLGVLTAELLKLRGKHREATERLHQQVTSMSAAISQKIVVSPLSGGTRFDTSGRAEPFSRWSILVDGETLLSFESRLTAEEGARSRCTVSRPDGSSFDLVRVSDTWHRTGEYDMDKVLVAAIDEALQVQI